MRARLRPPPLPSASGASVLGGATAPSAWGCGLGLEGPFPVQPPFPATTGSCQLSPIRERRIAMWITRITGVVLRRSALALAGLRRGRGLGIGRFPGVERAPGHVDRHPSKRVAELDRLLPGLARRSGGGARRPPRRGGIAKRRR